MARYIVTRHSTPRIVSYITVLVFLEWTIFLLFMYVDKNAFIQKNELYGHHISNETKTENREAILHPTEKQFQPSEKLLQPKEKKLQPSEKHLQPKDKKLQPKDKKLQPSEKQLQPKDKKKLQQSVKELQPKEKLQPSEKQLQPKQKLQPTEKEKKGLNDHSTTNMSLNNIRNCTEKKVKLSNTLLPVTGLVGFPGSGNTWVRHLLQQMTGIGTGSMYCDGRLRKKGFPFECMKDFRRTIVVKSHEEKHFIYFKKIVFLVRNPYDALLAYFAWAKAGHTGHPSKKTLQEACTEMFDWSVWWYVDLFNATLTRYKGPVHVLQYERLKTDTANEVEKLAKFLEVNVTQHDIDCTIKLREGNFHRKTNNAERLELLHAVYDSDKLLRLKNATRIVEKLFKDTLNLDVAVGNTVEKILLDKT